MSEQGEATLTVAASQPVACSVCGFESDRLCWCIDCGQFMCEECDGPCPAACSCCGEGVDDCKCPGGFSSAPRDFDNGEDAD